jgi:Tfp pilus assembly protein PilX
MTRPDRGGEEGAALIIALVFILTMGLLTGVLVTLASTNLMATTNLQAQRVGQYAADGALDVAVQTVRYMSPGATLTNCGSKAVVAVAIPTSGSNQDVTVYCGTAALGGARQVTFWACPTSASTSASSLSCQTAATSQAQILYNDVKPACVGNIVAACAAPGISLIVEQWSVVGANG